MSNRVTLSPKNEPNTLKGYDFSSITISNGLVTIESHGRKVEYKYSDLVKHITVWADTED